MNRLIFLAFSMLIVLAGLFSSCRIVGGIYKAGLWSGIIIVVLIISLVIFLINRKK